MKTDPNFQELLGEIQSRVDPEVHGTLLNYGYRWHFQYGFAKACYHKPREGNPAKLSLHKEGEEAPETLLITEDMTYKDLIELMTEALKTGRTVACGKGVGLNKLQFHIPGGGVDCNWKFLVPKVLGETEEPAWVLNPDYQRGPVWTREQQERFIGHALQGGKVNPLYVQRYDSKETSPVPEYWDLPVEVIDGQQRLRAIIAFIQGRINAKMWHEGQWLCFGYRDLNEKELRNHYLSSRIVYMDLPRKERLRFYLRLNEGGTPHTEEDLSKVRELLNAL